jgi:hypothetical protein
MKKALANLFRSLGLRWLGDWLDPQDGGGPKPVR